MKPLKPREELLTVEVWEEVFQAAEELYCRYLDLNRINLSAIRDTPTPQEVERNWNVPTGIEVTGDSRGSNWSELTVE